MSVSSILARVMSRIGTLFGRYKMPEQPKMYVLVRMDLSETYRMVQGAHALAQYALDQPVLFRIWGNGTIVFLGVRNLIELRKWETTLEMKGRRLSSFWEPDLDDQLTAIACYELGEMFIGLKTV